VPSERPDGPEGKPAHRAGATPHHPRGLLGGEAGDEAKDDGLLLVWRERSDRATQLTDLLATQADRLYLLTVGQIMDRVELLGGALATNVVDDRVARDAENPSRERPAAGALARQPRDYALEDELGQILGVLAPTNAYRDVAVEGGEELVVEVSEGGNVAVRRGPSENVERGVVPCRSLDRLGKRGPTLDIGDRDVEDDLQGSLAHVRDRHLGHAKGR
jgi:hypothetical protein